MQIVLIVFHIMIVTSLVAVILLQRSEGGALGVSSKSGFMSARGRSDALTRTTAVLASLFFATSLGLSMWASFTRQSGTIFPPPPALPASTSPSNSAPIDPTKEKNDPSSSEPTGTLYDQLNKKP